MNDLKTELHRLCTAYVQKRMDAATEAIEAAQQASTDDTKSSAGDKYETGREMMQQEQNRNSAQLNEANKLLIALNRISTAGQSATIDAGSLAITSNGNFYIAIGAGTLTIDSKSYFAVSPASPIALKLKGLKAGEDFALNGKQYLVQEVW